jgi:hypothetical protein
LERKILLLRAGGSSLTVAFGSVPWHGLAADGLNTITPPLPAEIASRVAKVLSWLLNLAIAHPPLQPDGTYAVLIQPAAPDWWP